MWVILLPRTPRAVTGREGRGDGGGPQAHVILLDEDALPGSTRGLAASPIPLPSGHPDRLCIEVFPDGLSFAHVPHGVACYLATMAVGVPHVLSPRHALFTTQLV